MNLLLPDTEVNRRETESCSRPPLDRALLSREEASVKESYAQHGPFVRPRKNNCTLRLSFLDGSFHSTLVNEPPERLPTAMYIGNHH